MSLDTATIQIAATEISTEIDGNGHDRGLSSKDIQKKLRKGPCPYYETCSNSSDSYYCTESRIGLVIRGKIVCYKPK
jgi:hypothetical protein